MPTEERRRQIAEAALDIIATEGVHHLTAINIAQRVGITDGSLFRHFASKEEIVTAAIDTFERTMDETLPERGDDPLADLERFFVNRLRVAHRHPETLRLAFNDRLAEAAGKEGAKRVEAVIQRSVSFVAECLSRARERGQLPADVPLEVVLWMVLGVLQGAARSGPSRARRSPGALGPEDVWRWLVTSLRRTG